LSGTQFFTLNSAGINDPEGPEKYNNKEVITTVRNVAFDRTVTFIKKYVHIDHINIGKIQSLNINS
jgi:hypothetical protein